MTGLLILIFVPLLVVVAFVIRLRGEQKARLYVERQLAELQQKKTRDATDAAEWSNVLAHEFRSPVAAILGYEELIQEGTFGPVDPRLADAAHRIRAAAEQLITLIEGLERIGAPNAGENEPVGDVPARDLVDAAVNTLRVEADGRGTSITTTGDDARLRTRPGEARRALTLLLGAAIKATPGTELHIVIIDGTTPRISVRGSRLQATRPADREAMRTLSGPSLRLELARHTARSARATIDFESDGTVRLELPRLD